MIPDRFRWLLALNPLSGLIETFRWLVAPSRPIDWNLLGFSVAITGILFVVGLAYFHSTERTMADIV